MTELHGFELIEARDVPELNTHARLFRHIKTGAELLSLENDDENKSFAISFRTPPTDDTGLPHILEHSVLCGSRKYPSKEPFVELIKTSMNTFLNAMTWPDRTVYPIASQNLQDFYNLVDVYMDAVLHPLITEDTLRQEGWHYETAEDGTLVYKGVVFNEMKGAYSVPESVLAETMQHSLYPDTPYAFDSGGDPAAIPNLTYEQFKTFHETYYHPSNAKIVFYGDDEPTERLRRMAEYLDEFEAIEVNSELPLQAYFDAPRTVNKSYDAGDEGADSNKSMTTVSWLLPEITDMETMMALEILSHALIDTPASPLRKALIDSGLGEDLVGSGFEDDLRQANFSVGLKGISGEDANTVEELILKTVSTLADDGIDPATIAASLNTIEFAYRERNTGRFPRGLMLGIIGILPRWTHGANPIDAAAFEASLENIKKQAAENDTYFTDMIGKYFVDNPHRVTVILTPDPQLGDQRDAAERARLDEARAGMSDADLEEIRKIEKELRIAQEIPDNPEDLAKIPTLTLADVEREVKTTPQEIIDYGGTQIFYHDLPTSGVAYLDIGLNLYALPQEYLPYLGLFGDALTEMGTESEDFVSLIQRIGTQTGGIGTAATTSVQRDGSGSQAYLFVRSKSMATQAQELLDLLRDILLTVKLDNQERFKQMVLERKARLEQFVTMGGHVVALRGIRAQFNDADWASEQMSGITNLFFVRELAEKVDSDWDSVLQALEAIRQHLVNRAAMIVNVTTEGSHWETFRPQLEAFLDAMPQNEVTLQTWNREATAAHTAYTAPIQVNYVGKGANLFELGYERNGSTQVVAKVMNLDYMWNEVRVKGGAYGGTMAFDPTSGAGVFVSWRDPNLVNTLNVYDGAADFLKTFEMSQEEIEKNILGTIGDLDSYLLPDAKGFSAMWRHLLGYTTEMRQQYRDEVLGTTIEDFHAFAEVLAKVAEAGHMVVVTSPKSVEEANTELSNPLTVVAVS